MSWRNLLIIGLCAIICLQVAFAAGYLLASHKTAAPAIVSFDPDTSLTMFVLWADGRMDNEQYAAALPVFNERLERDVEAFAAETGTVVITGNVVAGTDLDITDITIPIMERVLRDEAF